MATDADDKPSFAAYPGWLQKHHGITVDGRLENRYETAVRWIQRDFADSDLWKECNRDLVSSTPSIRSARLCHLSQGGKDSGLSRRTSSP